MSNTTNFLGTPAESSLNERGIAAARAGCLPEALGLFEQAVTETPESDAARNNLGNVFRRLGQWERAEAEIRTAVCLNPDEPDYHLNLAHLLHHRGRLAEAVVSARHAARLNPQRSDARRLLAELLCALHRLVEAAAAYRDLLSVAPSDAASHNELGNVLQRLGRLEEAEASYERAAEADPHLVAPVANRARLMADRGDESEARNLFLRAVRENGSPQLRIAAATSLPVIYGSSGEVTAVRARLANELKALADTGVRIDPTRSVIPNLFYLAYQGENDAGLMTVLAQLLTDPASRAKQWPTPKPSSGRRLRLGILSRYLCDHTVGRLNLGLAEQTPRNDFELIVVTVGQSDDSIARRYRKAADEVVPLPDDLRTALDRLLQARLDVLYFPDLGMDPFTFTLAASRVAPTQIMGWGHPDTTGLPTVDAFLSSAVELPSADAHYTERLIRLPRLGVMLRQPEFPLPADRDAFGLPADVPLYGCPQTLFKFHPDFDRPLAAILRADPEGRLVLLEGQHPGWTERLRRRFVDTMPDVLERVIWMPRLPRDRFRQLVSTCDVFLDPPHFGGGHTSYEAFACGVPVVTWPSDYLRGRLTLAMLQQMGSTELAARNADEYITTAVRLGTDSDQRRIVRQEILAARGELFDDRRALDAFFSAIISLAGR